MNKKQEQGDYYRNIIKVIETNLESLEKEKIKHGRFINFVKGVDKNIEKRRKDLYYYQGLLKEYVNNGWVS